ncbi:MAG: MOSC domain-containing protein [Candidatus Lutacidiplasmatales archaeon]
MPKPSVEELLVTAEGVQGDFNRYRHEEQHDEPNQAVMIMTVEMIRSLNADGWPLREGDIGENITTEGIPYGEFRPGDRFRLGSAVVEVTKPCTPCTNLYLLPYVGEREGPRFLKAMVDRRGWYASVVRDGRVRLRDPVERI